MRLSVLFVLVLVSVLFYLMYVLIILRQTSGHVTVLG